MPSPNPHPPGFSGGNIMPTANTMPPVQRVSVTGIAHTMLPEQALALPIHPIAQLLPPMIEADYAMLREDIRGHGQRQAIVLCDGMLLDGRHRVRACAEIGIPIRTAILPEDQNPLDYVMSVNLRRRSITGSQLAMIAARMVTTTQGNQSAEVRAAGLVTQAEAAARIGVSDRYVRDAAWLMENDEALATEVWFGRRALASAVRAARAARAPILDRTDENEPSIEQFPANPAIEPGAEPSVPQANVIRVAMAQITTMDYATWVRTLSPDELRTLLPAAESFFRLAFDLADEEGLLD